MSDDDDIIDTSEATYDVGDVPLPEIKRGRPVKLNEMIFVLGCEELDIEDRQNALVKAGIRTAPDERMMDKAYVLSRVRDFLIRCQASQNRIAPILYGVRK